MSVFAYNYIPNTWQKQVEHIKSRDLYQSKVMGVSYLSCFRASCRASMRINWVQGTWNISYHLQTQGADQSSTWVRPVGMREFSISQRPQRKLEDLGWGPDSLQVMPLGTWRFLQLQPLLKTQMGGSN